MVLMAVKYIELDYALTVRLSLKMLKKLFLPAFEFDWH
jgi:hypothetical protein